MNLSRARSFIIIAVVAGTAVGAPALEATTTNRSPDNSQNLNASGAGLSTFISSSVADINALTHKVDLCSTSGKLYAPTSPSRDANGCITVPPEPYPAVPSPGGSCPGHQMISNGVFWSCPVTFGLGSNSCGGVYCYNAGGAASLTRACVERGYVRYSALTATGSLGCNGCYFASWNGGGWASFKKCNSCGSYTSVTCY